MAERQGLALQKSRRRDPRAIGYGRYHLIDVQTNALATSAGDFGMSLDEVEQFLTGEAQ